MAVELHEDRKPAGLPTMSSFFREERVRMSTMASTGLELESKPRYRKGRYVTSTLWPVLVRDDHM